MFNFTHVLNATAGARYFISAATLDDGGNGFDSTPIGGNLYQIDLQPEDDNLDAIYDVALYVSNNGYVAQVSKNLDCESGWQDGDVFHAEMQDAIIEGKTLVITTRGKEA